MPLASRFTWTLRTRSDGTITETANAISAAFNGGSLLVYRAIGHSGPRVHTRRTLFELHAGREAFQLPTSLCLDEVNQPTWESGSVFNTSEDLIAALGPIGKEYARPKVYRNKVDLSFVHPMLAASNRKAAIEAREEMIKRQKLLREEKNDPMMRKSLLVSYLLYVDPILRYDARVAHPSAADPELDIALRKVFDRRVLSWLKLVDLEIEDVMNWAWILTADSSERGALRMTILANRSSKSEDLFRTIPNFLVLFLLRRQSIDARALKAILIYIWRLMEISEKSVSPVSVKNASIFSDKRVERQEFQTRNNINTMPEHIFMVLVIRLLRSAAKAWPAACESIIALLGRYLEGISLRRGISRSALLHTENSAYLTYAYNTLLRLLSVTSSLNPFLSAIFQQRAQFSLLKRMNSYFPPLIVDKRGYRAVVKLQLMHKKTMKEREWAHMKAKSWPPWKEDKLGIDADIGAERGVSRAKEVLNRAKEAGYSADGWDDAAGILSGWDTDGSPTIQTRSAFKIKLDRSKKSGKTHEGAIWAARIQATRTLDEAWSCFLSCMDRTDALQNNGEPIFFAMFMKLVYDVQRSSVKGGGTPNHASSDGQPLPGDGLEVLAAPISPREATYVRRPPPSLDEFLEMMVGNKIQPSDPFLVFLLRKAWSFEAGLRCLEASGMRSRRLSTLFDQSAGNDPRSRAALDSISDKVFAAVIAFLARFAPTMFDKHGRHSFERVRTGLELAADRQGWTEDPNPSHRKPTSGKSLYNPLQGAYRLLTAKRSNYRPAWYHLIRALSHPRAVTGVYSRFANQDHEDIKTWQLLCKLLDQMFDVRLHVDLEGFGLICKALEKAIFASERQLRLPRHVQTDDDWTESLFKQMGREQRLAYYQFVLHKGTALIKEIFKDAVRITGMQQELPAAKIAEKSEIDDLVKNIQDETMDEDNNDEGTDHDPSEDELACNADQKPDQPKAFLPPACLLPKLLEVPHPSVLHSFIRILGLRRDYEGILEVIEWMALYADEIGTVMDVASNGQRMMRRCVIATQVFLERSWISVPRNDEYDQAGKEGIVIEADPAPADVVRAVRGLVSENKSWGGWPTSEEVTNYCLNGRFL